MQIRISARCVVGVFLAIWAQESIADAATLVKGLSLSDQAALSEAVALGRGKIVGLFLLTSADRRALHRIESLITTKGGRITYAESRIGYIRAAVSIKQYEALIREPAVAAAQIDGSDSDLGHIAPPYDPRPETPEDVPQIVKELAELASTKPLVTLSEEKMGSPVVASSFLGLSEWFAAHPTFDGRGVTIATAEPLGDLLDHPSFRRALSLDGDLVPKFGRIFGSPALLSGAEADEQSGFLPLRASDLSRVSALIQVHTDAEGFFTVGDRRYRAPAPGEYRYQQQSMGNGYYTPDDHLYSVLWRQGEKVVWVDVNEDNCFEIDEAVGDFNQTHQVGHLPKAPSSMAAAGHSLAFVVYFDSNSGLPRLLASDNAHSTWTSGAMAGHNFGGGDIGSAAPNAQVDAQFGTTAQARPASQVLEEIIEASLSQGTDLLSSSMGTGDTMPHLPDAFSAQVLDGLVNITRKPQFWAAGNDYAATATILGPSVASKVMSVGAYLDAASLQRLGGYAIGRAGFIAPYSYGPSNSGQMKPDFIAPFGGITTGLPWWPGMVPAGRFPAPGYAWLPGTSLSTPSAASAAADLISGAKQSGVPYDAGRIYWAMKAGAQFLEDWPAQSQGAGLINLGASWRMLTLAAKWPEWRLAPKIDVRAPLRTRWVELTRESIGSGLYEREGWNPGNEGDRVITLVRHDGPRGGLHYWLQWLGNDGTFQILGPAQNDVVLDLEKPVELKVHIGPLGAGAHSATLELLDSEERVPVLWTAFTVIAADQLKGDSVVPFSSERAVNREVAVPAHHFVDIPTGTQLLRIDIKGETGGLQLIVDHPLEADAHDEYSALERVWETPQRDRLLSAHEKIPQPDRTYLAGVPSRGVWEFIMLDHSGWQVKAEPFSEQYTIRATALSASLTAAKNRRGFVSISAHNKMGALEEGRLRMEMGMQQHARLDSQHAVKTIEVPDNVSSLWLRALSSKTHRPVRLWVYCDAQSPNGEPTLLEVPFEARPSVTVRRPKSGRWRIVVAENDLAQGAAELDILETSSRYGAPILGDASPRGSGEVWQEDLPLPTNPPVAELDAVPTLLVELEDMGVDAIATAGLDSPLPQRPTAVGQLLLNLN